MTKENRIPKMTRAQIAEALETVPLDTVILGSRTGSKLTAKQKEFARNLALGKSKAQAYREAYKSKGNSKTHAANGYKVAQSADVQQIREAYEVAIEAAKQRTPAQLRELVIHQLTRHAIDEDINPAQRIQALKLLGTITEVAAFTERRETTTIRKSEDVRAALLEKLRTISGSAVDAVLVTDDNGADSLLAEITKGQQDNEQENGQPASGDDLPAADPTHQPPPSLASDHLATDLHNVPHSQPPLKSDEPVFYGKSMSQLMGEEVIGEYEIVAPHIEIDMPIVAEKVPAEDPTPSDMETPPGAFSGEK